MSYTSDLYFKGNIQIALDFLSVKVAKYRSPFKPFILKGPAISTSKYVNIVSGLNNTLRLTIS